MQYNQPSGSVPGGTGNRKQLYVEKRGPVEAAVKTGPVYSPGPSTGTCKQKDTTQNEFSHISICSIST